MPIDFARHSIQEWMSRRDEIERTSRHEDEEEADLAVCEVLCRCDRQVQALLRDISSMRTFADDMLLAVPSFPARISIPAATIDTELPTGLLGPNQALAAARSPTAPEDHLMYLSQSLVNLALRDPEPLEAQHIYRSVRTRKWTLDDYLITHIVLLVALCTTPKAPQDVRASSLLLFQIINKEFWKSAELVERLVRSALAEDVRLLQREAETIFRSITDISGLPGKHEVLTALKIALERCIESLPQTKSLTQTLESAQYNEDSLMQLARDGLRYIRTALDEKLYVLPNNETVTSVIINSISKSPPRNLFLLALAAAEADGVSSGNQELPTKTLLSCAENISRNMTLETTSLAATTVASLFRVFVVHYCCDQSIGTHHGAQHDDQWINVIRLACCLHMLQLAADTAYVCTHISATAASFASILMEQLPQNLRDEIQRHSLMQQAFTRLRDATHNAVPDCRKEVFAELCKIAKLCEHLIDLEPASQVEEAPQDIPTTPEPQLPNVQWIDRKIFLAASGHIGLEDSQPNASPSQLPNSNADLKSGLSSFSLDNLIRQSRRGKSGEAVASIIGKLAAWGNK